MSIVQIDTDIDLEAQVATPFLVVPRATTTSAKPRIANPLSKPVIDNVSGSITGGFWAIMGASGSGKTTLWSALYHTKYINIEGEFHLNGKQYSRHLSAHVMQDDVLHAELTVEETLLLHVCVCQVN